MDNTVNQGRIPVQFRPSGKTCYIPFDIYRLEKFSCIGFYLSAFPCLYPCLLCVPVFLLCAALFFHV